MSSPLCHISLIKYAICGATYPPRQKKEKNHYLKLNYSAWRIHYSVVLKYMSAPYKSYDFVGQMSPLFAFKEYLNLY